MKKALILLFLTLLLCGCDAGDRGITNVSTLTSPTETLPSFTQGVYDPYSTLERQTAGAVKTFVLPLSDAYGIRTLGSGILVFSGVEQTALTLLSGETLQPESTLSLGFFLDHKDPSLQIDGDTLSFFDPVSRETIVANKALTVINRFPMPEGSQAAPVFSGEQNTVYYATEDALYAWDLESGRHRLLRSNSEKLQFLGLHSCGSILACCRSEESETLFISTDSGKLLFSQPGPVQLTTRSAHFYAVTSAPAFVFGIAGEQAHVLKPREPQSRCIFLDRTHGALTVSTPDQGKLHLDHYDLNSGLRTATLMLSEHQEPLAVSSHEDHVYLLAFDPKYDTCVIYRWNVHCGSLRDSAVYTALHYTAENPDHGGLVQCRVYASALEETYGIRILFWKDAVKAQPWDYDLEPEHQADVIMQELRSLDTCLSQYPREILEQTAGHFSSLNICLVRSITGSVESGQQDPATGIQYQQGTDAYVALAAGAFSDRALYHELFHVMETHIFGNSLALDQWNSLNPAGFSYDYSYIQNKTRESGVYLQHDTRAFVDTYSMSYPKEDRARIMEYAMMPGNQDLFRFQTLQRKLQTLCRGIREAYGLEKSTEVFLWEQYLD